MEARDWQMDKLIALTEKYSDGDEIRITVETNLIVPHIPDAKLGASAAAPLAAAALLLSAPVSSPRLLSDRQAGLSHLMCVRPTTTTA